MGGLTHSQRTIKKAVDNCMGLMPLSRTLKVEQELLKAGWTPPAGPWGEHSAAYPMIIRGPGISLTVYTGDGGGNREQRIQLAKKLRTALNESLSTFEG